MTFFINLSIQSELQLFSEELYEYLTLSFLENLAKELGFVQRKRKFSGHDLATICVWINQRVASDSLVRLCSQVHAFTGTLYICRALKGLLVTTCLKLIPLPPTVGLSPFTRLKKDNFRVNSLKFELKR